MPDFKEMYLTLFRANELAIRTLVAAQRECEEKYLDARDLPIQVLRPDTEEEQMQQK